MSAAPFFPFDTAREDPPRKKFTREDVERLTAYDFFERQRFELINGDLIDRAGQKPPHSFAVQSFFEVLVRIFGFGFVRGQSSLDVSKADRERNEPEPDLVVTELEKTYYLRRHPRGDECILVAEVSERAARFHLTVKAGLYARAGVREYWVVDLNRRLLVVLRLPRDGGYRSIQLFDEGDVLSLEGRTEIIRVTELLPPTAPDTEQ